MYCCLAALARKSTIVQNHFLINWYCTSVANCFFENGSLICNFHLDLLYVKIFIIKISCPSSFNIYTFSLFSLSLFVCKIYCTNIISLLFDIHFLWFLFYLNLVIFFFFFIFVKLLLSFHVIISFTFPAKYSTLFILPFCFLLFLLIFQYILV